LVLIEVVLQFPTTCSQLFFTKTDSTSAIYPYNGGREEGASDCNFQKYQLLEFLFLHESREACKLVLSIPERIVERRTAVHPVRAFTSIGRDCVGCFIGAWKGDCLGSSSHGQPHDALPLHQVTQRQVIKFTDPMRRSGHTTCYTHYKGVCISG
jgi:hypothetical protein